MEKLSTVSTSTPGRSVPTLLERSFSGFQFTPSGQSSGVLSPSLRRSLSRSLADIGPHAIDTLSLVLWFPFSELGSYLFFVVIFQRQLRVADALLKSESIEYDSETAWIHSYFWLAAWAGLAVEIKISEALIQFQEQPGFSAF
jgi:hypothetical protein